MTNNKNIDHPRVFISYSWDSPEHKLWVESLARELRKAGIDARLDAWRNESQSIDDFMMIELERADYVVAICTPQFKKKIVQNAEGISGTASGFEIGTAAALRRSGGKDIIPVLRAGDWLESAPSSLVSYRFYDLTNDDISEEFQQLRDRLLGHVRRPPELGAPSSPAAGPELPDIFARGSRPDIARGPAPSPEAQPSAVPAQGQQTGSRANSVASVASSGASKGRGKVWIWVGAAVVGIVVLLSLVPESEDAGDTAEMESLASQTPEGEEFGDSGESGSEWSPEGESFDDDGGDMAPASPQAQSASGDIAEVLPSDGLVNEWGFVADENGCLVLTQLGSNSWLMMAYEASRDVFVLHSYDSQWSDIEVGKLYKIVLEMDEDPNLLYRTEATGINDDGVPGVEVAFTSIEFLQALAQRHLLGFYWDAEPYSDYWVLDAELSGSSAAVQQLVDCTANFGES